jgi:hypothetical protein
LQFARTLVLSESQKLDIAEKSRDLGLALKPTDVQGSLLQDSISAENFSDKFSPSDFAQISAQKRQIIGFAWNNLGFKVL